MKAYDAHRKRLARENREAGAARRAQNARRRYPVEAREDAESVRGQRQHRQAAKQGARFAPKPKTTAAIGKGPSVPTPKGGVIVRGGDGPYDKQANRDALSRS